MKAAFWLTDLLHRLLEKRGSAQDILVAAVLILTFLIILATITAFIVHFVSANGSATYDNPALALQIGFFHTYAQTFD